MDSEEINRRMQGAVGVLKGELAGLRTGRASSSLLEPLQVQAYGTSMPLNQMASVSVPEARMLSVQVWDKSNVHAVEKAIRESNLGLNPIVEGTLLRVPIPELNAERRQELVKVAHKYAEAARVAVRHVRRDAIDGIKKQEKDGEIGQDQAHVDADKVQTMTDSTISEVDQILADKEAEITQV
jgi:ribosome recycling factor